MSYYSAVGAGTEGPPDPRPRDKSGKLIAPIRLPILSDAPPDFVGPPDPRKSSGTSAADIVNSMFSAFGAKAPPAAAPKIAPARGMPANVYGMSTIAPYAPAYSAPSSGTIMGIKTPYLIGGVAVLGLAAFLLMRKKRPAAVPA